jgi:hypothetical protein
MPSHRPDSANTIIPAAVAVARSAVRYGNHRCFGAEITETQVSNALLLAPSNPALSTLRRPRRLFDLASEQRRRLRQVHVCQWRRPNEADDVDAGLVAFDGAKRPGYPVLAAGTSGSVR